MECRNRKYTPRTLTSFLDRLDAKIHKPRLANGSPDFDQCFPWLGAKSRSGYRKTQYGTLTLGRRGLPTVRAHRVVLAIHTGIEEVPRDPTESLDCWIMRLLRAYSHLEAAHAVCDYSLCCNQFHLAWQSHAKNVTDQAIRRREEREKEYEK